MGREDLVRLLAQPQEGNLNINIIYILIVNFNIETDWILICSCDAVHSWNEDGLPWAQEATRSR